jgi:lipopolysaccharide export system permease protein
MLENARTTTFEPDRTVATRAPEVTIRSTINPAFLRLAAADPDLLTLRSLAAYIAHLRHNHLQAVPYEIGFWSRIARIFAVVVVTLLALPFVFGPLRTTGAGTRTVVGVLLGLVFFVINGIGEKGGQLFGLNPILIGWLPTAVIAVGTLIAISRTR